MSGFDTRCRSIVFRLGMGVLAASALALAGGATNAPSAAAGLVAAYAFDEGAGPSVADASGNGNQGTISGAWWTDAGHQGGGLAFDGIDDLVTIADAASLDLTTGMTLEAWVKPDTFGSSTTAAVLKERSGGLVYGLQVRSGTLGPGAAVHNGVTETRARTPLQIPNGLWSHLAATYDGAAVRVYVNGLELASAIAPGGIAASASPLRLGGSSAAREWFAGTLDDVRIYNRALSATEIAADMLTPVVGPARDTSPPSTPSGLRVLRRTQASIDLAWNPSSDDRAVDRYGIYLDGDYVAASSTTSTTVGRLSCGRTYTLTVDAADSAGNRSGQASVSATTMPCPDTTAPTAPTGLTRTGSTQTSVTLSWNAAADDTGVAEYGAYQGTAKVATLASSTRTHTFTGLACGTSYALGVDAADAAGNRSARATLTAGTSACPDTTPPSTPTGLRVTATSPTSVAIAWTASSDNVGVAGYGLYVDGAAAGTRTSTAATITALTCEHTYVLGVDAYDAAGNRSGRATVSATTGSCADTTPPSSPTGLAVIGRTATAISLSWNASTDNVGVSGYALYADGASAGTSATTSGTVTGLACGRTYTLGVEAYDAAGNDSARATVSGSTSTCPDATPPAAPAGFAQTSSTQTTVTVTWTPATDNVGVTEHGLYRDGNPIATLGGSASSYTFGGLVCGSSYLLGVDAADAAGNRSSRASAAGTTAACSSGGGGTPSVFLSPTGSDSNPCTQAQRCKTLDRAYRVADPGDVVELAGGTYAGEQSIPDVTKSGTAKVVFRPAPGASVTLGDGIGVWGDHVEFRGLTITDDFYVKCGADDVTLRDSKASLFFIRSATNISFIDVEFGPSHDISQIGHTEDCQFSPDNILMDRVYMHDFWWDGTAQSTHHMECLTISAANNFTLRNSRFHRCEDFDILVKHRYPVLKSTNMTFENNWFDAPWPDGTYAISFSQPDSGGTYENVLIRNNSFVTPLLLRPEINWRNLQVIGNVGVRTGGDCRDYVSRHNVWSSMAPCSTTDRQAPPGFVNPSAFDLHLRPDSAAVDRGDPTSYPATDIDGEARPRGGAPDAGADESPHTALAPASGATSPGKRNPFPLTSSSGH